MPTELPPAGGPRFNVRYLDWTEEQSRQWVQGLAKLCVKSYCHNNDLPSLPNDSPER